MKRFTLALVSLSVVLNALAFSTSNYVQDGLIACWDGIENAGKGVHDSEATVWTDIVGGKKFALTTGVTVDAEFVVDKTAALGPVPDDTVAWAGDGG